MKYFSTNRQSPPVDFREATLGGLAPDRGLYFPEVIPRADDKAIKEIKSMPEPEIAFRIIKPYIGNTIPEKELLRVVEETINFPFPLAAIGPAIYALELFHGPTAAFKDVGARFMSRCLGYFVRNNTRKTTVLVATSGDTGGAVADGFYNTAGIDVVILYPSGKVSPVQEKQLTTHGKNIHALEIKGNFDDCQQLVKTAFADPDLRAELLLSSANSINVARWLPQQFYYFFAYKYWPYKNQPPVLSVPSGNFGNICAGLLARQSGLPLGQFIAACNANAAVSDYLKTSQYKPGQAVTTLSNAMDVGDPSNFKRVLEIFGNKYPDIKENLFAYNITDQETMDIIREVYSQYQYILDPHGAVGYLSLKRYLDFHPGQRGIFLETAHPVKFPEAVEKATGKKISLPAAMAVLLEKPKQSIVMDNNYQQFKDYLLG